MKFKENAIKPGMVIHCPKEEDARVLLEHLDSLGYIWEDTLDHLTDNTRYDEGDTYFLDYIKGENITFLRVTHDSRDWAIENGYAPTEFSDLIEPDEQIVEVNKMVTDLPMSAVEVLEWLDDKDGDRRMIEVFGDEHGNSKHDVMEWYTPQEIVDQITAYEAAKKAPKPVEVEWVRLCRIIQIQDNGFKKCVYEKELRERTPFSEEPYYSEQTETILKKYVSEHCDKYIAVIEEVCRVKEDK